MKPDRTARNRNAISRRAFINKTAAGSAGIVFGPFIAIEYPGQMQAPKWPENAGKYKFHLIGQAHIDPVWLWPWHEGLSVVHSTFRSALDRMNETPDFTFTASSAQFYEWVADNDPEMLREIRKRVEEGRWNAVGGWWVEPDMNLPCGEAMVRQGLYGQMTFQKLLGRRATVAYNPDSFGHTGTLPQIIRSQGMENYVFMRPGPKEKDIPSDLFWWESPDGTRVLTYRIPISYNDSRSVRNRIEQVLVQLKDQPFKTFMTYYGAGDHGGGATKENIGSINEIRAEKGAPAVVFSTPEKYFSEIRKDSTLNLPVIQDDLQHHATGCYTAESSIKKYNRQAEAALIAAEKVASIGSVIWKYKYPAAELTAAWKRVLFLQFHDSLAGSSLPSHSESAREGYGYAIDVAHNVLYKAVQKLEWQVAAEDPASQYLLAFNPHAWEVTASLEYDLDWDERNPSVAEDETGEQLEHQWTAATTETGRRKGLLVRATLPPFGYRQIRIRQGDAGSVKNRVTVENNILENEHLRIFFSPSGTIGITLKESGKELFNGGATGCRAVIIDDPGDTWSHDIKAFDRETGEFGNAVVKVIERGPLRAVARVFTSYGESTLVNDWILYSGSKIVESRITLNWHEKLKMLKFSFPVNVITPVATYETPYGFIQRAADGNEDPGQRWIDVTGLLNGQKYGLTVINDAKYGYSVKENDMRISVARSAVFAHHNPRVLDMNSEHIWQDQGLQTLRMLLVPHEGSWQAGQPVRRASELLEAPAIIYQGIHGGSMPKSASFLSVDSDKTEISSVKKAETGDDLIIRCVETSGENVKASVDLKFIGKKWEGNFRPCEIKSLRVNIKTGEIKEVNLLEE
ncbi:MAG TPA: glycoside hydrolase family 38 C-terminal domain-containing protein [Bacteroidales bacterium]|jgi:alpha-mannosidase|nr:glycoside hydrolase family 38 C-terminal domain-containing protein [Bacteroidales bacterium]